MNILFLIVKACAYLFIYSIRVKVMLHEMLCNDNYLDNNGVKSPNKVAKMLQHFVALKLVVTNTLFNGIALTCSETNFILLLK